jgi:hypothetical protein
MIRMKIIYVQKLCVIIIIMKQINKINLLYFLHLMEELLHNLI